MTEEAGISQQTEGQVKYNYPYDAVIILGGGMQKVGDKYYPTDYRHGDEFGMLGAGIRMVAAVDLYLNKQANNFVFSTGVTAKDKEMFGEDVPTEASVYADKFLRSLEGLKKREELQDKFTDVESPVIMQEDRSFNTASNIKEVLQIVKDQGWHNVVIVSSNYHIPRVQALYERALMGQDELDIHIAFIKAEEYVEKVERGKYDNVIEDFTDPDKNPLAGKRYENENKGLQDIQDGMYHLGEFQLKNKKHDNEN